MTGRVAGFLLIVVVGLGAALHPAWALTESDRKAYRAAFVAAQKGDMKAAAREAATAHDRLPAEALHWFSLIHAGNGASFAELAQFITAHPDWPNQQALEQRAEEAMSGVSDSTAEDWFSRHPPLTVTGKLREADLWRASGRVKEADELIRDVWVNGDFSAFDETSMLQRYVGVLGIEDNEKRMTRLLWSDQTAASRRMLPLVGTTARGIAEARLALAAMNGDAEAMVARLPQNLQSDLGLLYDRVRWRRRNNMDDGAIDLLAVAPQDPAHAAQWAAERQTMARRALVAGRPDMALRLAEHHDTTTGQTFAELEFLSGWIALRFLNKPEVAYEHFVRLYDAMKLPITLARGAYWAGRAAEAMGYRELAAAWFDTAAERVTTYYGQLAAAKRNAQPARFLTEPRPSATETAAFNQRELVRLARDLGEANADDMERPFIHRLTDLAETPVDYLLVTRLALEIGRADLAVDAAKRAGYQGVNLIAEGYPIATLPKGGKVEAPLLLALTRQESAFDHQAVSRSGALGLMQLMPKTASLIAKALKIPFNQKRLTQDRQYNVTLGRAYLESLLADFSGSYVLAVAAYNAGPARVKEWQRDYGDPRSANVDVVDWIESIPYYETRNYVQRVLENLQIYRYRLGETGLSFTLASDLKR
ncbi:MAG TPA: lytic transglycosylase domain-containing protein [Stellaceae bacterium]|nr:lytic transglycosylase domain-containing protein [Stellaceae bacterium]